MIGNMEESIDTNTPATVTKQILKLCKKIVPSGNPFYVDVIPEDGCQINECFPNVEGKVKRDGGRLQHGWQIWEWPNVMIEAEFHAVWMPSGSNTYMDITPKVPPTEVILFLPDNVRAFTGRRIDNVRMALSRDKLVRDMIYLTERICSLIESSSHVDNPLVSTIPIREMQPVATMRQYIIEMIKTGKTENDLCFCGSGRKYKNCCSL